MIKKMKKYSIRIAFFSLLLLTLQSCFVAKEYNRKEVVDSKYFRTDTLAKDSTTLAGVSWRNMFTDSLLIGYIEEGLENNIDIRIALQQIITARAYYLQGKAGYLPTINGTGQVTHQQFARNSQFGSFFDGGLTQYELSGSLSWEADIWGKIRSNKRATQATYLQSVAAHQAVKTELVAGIASAYFQLLALDEQKRITEETIVNRRNSLETTKALKESGSVSEVAVKQTEAQLYSAEAILVDLDRTIKLVENTLSIFLGREPGSISRGTLQDNPLVARDITVGYPVQLLRNRPDVRAAEAALVNAFELTNVARSNFYPTLRITSTGGFQSIQLDEWLSANSLFANIIGGITQPVLNGRRIRTQYEVAQSQQEIAFLNFRKSVLTASREVSDGMYSLHAAGQRVAIKSKEFEAYDLATTYSEELLENGLANYLEVLTARQNALNSQIDIINAQLASLNATVEIYRALGGGWQ